MGGLGGGLGQSELSPSSLTRTASVAGMEVVAATAVGMAAGMADLAAATAVAATVGMAAAE